MRTKPFKQRVKTWAIVIIIVGIYVWAFAGLPEIALKESASNAITGILQGFVYPDWDYVYDPGGEDLLRALLETLAIAILGTFISAVLCIPFAFMAARNMSKHRIISSTTKVILSAIRVFPELIMALFFIKAVGLGPFAGILALGFHSIGMLGKLISEAIEDMDFSPTEALIASGANRMQVIWFAIVPQVLPAFLSYTLYRLEISVRSATTLGIVGAGGVGAPLIFALHGHSWDRVGIILIGIIVMVTMIDLISGVIRRRIV
ncbi:phosphonate ABC transporter, permease protein PhnE [Priestia taiwanensis]|uniref:Phosphonate ABC transporter, permease protein PhnE n=1 Tax=Priestia taiwanensis TaxID=1347902 RepID=A0A917AKE8_9BACI|nr:phosphonate ABC transporter, permease protein PhnE [Priestia taiwanensis]MBM7362052.1 phosphonate transport system permease protein [Priestia taiwanensis]GGE59078.1 phosphonate ABC transporter, permease protein PhnE [Priestia taiwanensis]